jgi:uncharacterized repeat protein (TIGR01451 family)
MKNILILLFFLALYNHALAQDIGINKLQGGPDNSPQMYADQFNSIKQTPDGGYIVAGFTPCSNSGTLPGLTSNGSVDGWVVKYDTQGNVQWQKLLGGQRIDILESVQLTRDGGYIFAGYSQSSDAGTLMGVTANGAFDYWVVKMDRDGNTQWQGLYGSTANDRGNEIKQTQDGGYIVIGYSEGSNSGTMTGEISGGVGYTDAWVLKLDGNGNVQWQKLLGGSLGEYTYAIEQATDGGYVFAGYSQLPNGTQSGWLVKLDATGIVLWQQFVSYGNSNQLSGLCKTTDGGFVAVGQTFPINNGVGYGWIVKINGDGTTAWQKMVGESGADYLGSVQQTSDGGYIIGGSSNYSNAGTATNLTPYGFFDAWVVKVDGNGTPEWQKLFGGANSDNICDIQQTANGRYVFVGYSNSYNSGTLTSIPSYGGLADAWLFEFGPSNTIKGAIFVDSNLNGIKDASENFYTGATKVYVTSSTDTALTMANNGLFSARVKLGVYQTYLSKDTLQLYEGTYKMVPSRHTSSFAKYGQEDSFSFALQPVPKVKDVQVSIIPLTPAKPGFTATYRLFYKNVGNVIIPSGYVQFNEEWKVNLISTNPASNNVDTLQWKFTGFSPGDTASVLLTFQIPLPPRVNNGDSLLYNAFPVIGDSLLNGRRTELKQVVVSSFDPNDKTENHGGQVPLSFISDGSYLQYTIRFQNIGTGNATNVEVKDTLSDGLDASSFEMITTSHTYMLTFDGGKNLTWSFSNIELPPSSIDEPNSHGFITYRIRPKNNVAAGETLHNTASIYFDFNEPVVTNDATTLIQGPMITLPQTLLNFWGSRLRETMTLNWKVAAGNAIGSYALERSTDGSRFEVIGNLTGIGSQNQYSFTDNVALLAGKSLFYRLKMTTADRQVNYSQVLHFTGGGQRDGLAVHPNPVNGKSFVSFTSTFAGKAEIQLFNASGTILHRNEVQVHIGRNSLPVSGIEALPAGVYFIRLGMANKEMKTSPFVVQ